MAKVTQKLGELVDLKALILNTASQIREARQEAKEEAAQAGHDAVMEFSGCEIELAVTAATKSANTWERVDDPATNLFWKSAYDMAVREFPILEMKEPHYTKGTRWIGLRPSCLPTQPKRVSVEIKGARGYVDLSFANTAALEFQSQTKHLLGEFTVHPTGQAAAIRIEVEPFGIAEGVESGLPKIRQAFAAAERLVMFFKEHQSVLLAAANKSVLPT